MAYQDFVEDFDSDEAKKLSEEYEKDREISEACEENFTTKCRQLHEHLAELVMYMEAYYRRFPKDILDIFTMRQDIIFGAEIFSEHFGAIDTFPRDRHRYSPDRYCYMILCLSARAQNLCAELLPDTRLSSKYGLYSIALTLARLIEALVINKVKNS